MAELSATKLPRTHRTRLMQIWRSAGWPCKDAVEIDLLAAGMVTLHGSADGRETLKLSDAGIQWLAAERQRNQRALSAHDRLALKMAEQLMGAGRIVWRELSLRAQIEATAPMQVAEASPLWPEADAAETHAKAPWRIARPDLFSVRNTSVEAYLQPVVHEIKVSRADLLSDLRHGAKRQSYQWLSCECHYVFPAGIAEPEEIPEAFGIWLLHGDIASGRLEPLRPARHASCTLPFAVWLALAKATPLQVEGLGAQAQLGAGDGAEPP
ncbi:MAG: hypothetical protein IV097_04075 [Burkholderiaceae bacterium]|nr:hypothetical protein [Burkholderiaceae bacterium]